MARQKNKEDTNRDKVLNEEAKEFYKKWYKNVSPEVDRLYPEYMKKQKYNRGEVVVASTSIDEAEGELFTNSDEAPKMSSTLKRKSGVSVNVELEKLKHSLNEHSKIVAEEDKTPEMIAHENAQKAIIIENFLDSLPYTNPFRPNLLIGFPPWEIEKDEIENSLPTELLSIGVTLDKILYQRPVTGKVAKGVEIHLKFHEYIFIKEMAFKFNRSVEQKVFEELDVTSFRISKKLLDQSPEHLERNKDEEWAFGFKDELSILFSISDITVENDHNTNQPRIEISVQLRNEDYDPAEMVPGPKFFTRYFNLTPKFQYSDVDLKFKLASSLDDFRAQTDAPPLSISNLQLDKYFFEKHNITVGIPYLPNDEHDYDRNQTIIPTIIPINIFGNVKELSTRVIFKESYNENKLKNLNSLDIKVSKMNRFRTTYDEGFNERAFENAFITERGLFAKLKPDSLIRYPAEPDEYSGDLIIKLGKFMAFVPFDGTLTGLGLSPVSEDLLVIYTNEIEVSEIPKEALAALNSEFSDDSNVALT